MRVASVLRDIFHPATQTEVAEVLRQAGMKTQQTMVSTWYRGRVPSDEQLAIIEDTYGYPRGWVLYRAGMIDPIEILKRVVAETIVSVSAAKVRRELDRFRELLEELEGGDE